MSCFWLSYNGNADISRARLCARVPFPATVNLLLSKYLPRFGEREGVSLKTLQTLVGLVWVWFKWMPKALRHL